MSRTPLDRAPIRNAAVVITVIAGALACTPKLTPRRSEVTAKDLKCTV
jgi:hypothetical protein